MPSNVFIHVGLQKTGTSFLQENVFKNIDVNYIRYLDRGVFFENIDYSKPIVLSNEDLCGFPHMVFHVAAKTSRYHIARKLSVLFPGARIIVGLRDKNGWLISLYREAVRQGLSLGFQEFLDLFDKHMLDFDDYIRLLEGLFPSVFVYRFEDLKHDYMSVVKGLCDFIGVSRPVCIENMVVNKSISDWQIPGFRLLNRCLYSKGYNPNGLVPHSWFGYIYDFIRGDGVQ